MRFAAERAQYAITLDIEAIAQRGEHRDAHDLAAGPSDPVRSIGGLAVVSADHRDAALFDAGRQQRLDGGVVLHGTMSLGMVFCNVEQYADGGSQRRRKIDLIGRHFEHVMAPCRKWLEREPRNADISPQLRDARG